MSHPKNKVMERMTPLERWNGLAWVCSTWLWKGLARCRGGVCSGTTVFPRNTTRSTRQAFSVWVTRHFHFFPRHTKDKPWKQRLRERTNRRLRRQPSKKHSKPMFRARFVTCSRTHQGMDTDGLEELGFSKKSHQRSQSTGCVLVRKAPTNPHSQNAAQQIKANDLLRQGANVKSTWPGCEVKLGTCHCLQYHSHMFHTRIPGWSSPTTESILCGGEAEVCQTKPLL